MLPGAARAQPAIEAVELAELSVAGEGRGATLGGALYGAGGAAA